MKLNHYKIEIVISIQYFFFRTNQLLSDETYNILPGCLLHILGLHLQIAAAVIVSVFKSSSSSSLNRHRLLCLCFLIAQSFSTAPFVGTSSSES